jgi:hypothetical protein
VLVSGRAVSGRTAEFAGHFKQTQWRSVAEMIINITVTLVCVNLIGIYGVLIGTIVALLYRSNDMIIYNCKYLIKRSAWVTYKKWAVDIAVFVLIVFISNLINIEMDSYIKIILVCIPYVIAISVLYFVAASLTDIKSYKLGYELVKSVISEKLKSKKLEG